MINIFYDCYRVLSPVYSEGAFLKRSLTDTQIEEKNRSHITKICYGVLDKDIELSYYLNILCNRKPKGSIRIILKISMYSIKYLKTAPYAVVDTAVELIKKMGKSGVSGFVNAFLRRFSTQEIKLPDDKIKRLSVQYSYPEFAVRKLIKDYSEERAISIMSADSERTFVRFNNGVDGEKYLVDRKWNYETTPFKNVYFINGFKRDSDFDKGIYTFQSVGSVAICEMVPSGDNLLDACAAPGGKSVFLSDKFKSIISCDIHEHRVKLIEEYSSRMGKENILPFLCNSSVYNPEFDSKFDCVLTDVPCSGFGVIKDNPDIKIRRTEQDVNEIFKSQLAILSNCAKYVKSGGFICYSTCSIFSIENECVIKTFLIDNNDFCIDDVDSDLPHEKREVGIQFLPDISMGAGFYFCRLKRK